MKFCYSSVQDEPEALHRRTVRFSYPENYACLLFLYQGALTLGEHGQEISGPALCYWPAGRRPTLIQGPGARLRLLALSDPAVLDAIGARAESAHLRMLTSQPFCTAVEAAKDVQHMEFLLRFYEQECNDQDLQSPMSLAAYLRLMLVTASRLYSPEPAGDGSDKTCILRRFRHLVELHYRDHWQIASYAEQLEVDRDRLHRICKRETGRSPAELVHERLTAEAKVRLERSGFPLKTIAADLGFADATRFSHFFKRRTDMSPGAYRAIVSAPDANELLDLKRGFSDWP